VTSHLHARANWYNAETMLNRRTTGSVVCPSCGSLVGVRDDKCYTCGRSNPGLWGFGPMLRNLGADFGFAQLVLGACVTLWVITLLMSGGAIRVDNVMSALAPSTPILFLFGASGAIPVFSFGRGVTGFTLSSVAGAYLPALPFLHGAGFTVGASAPVFGLIGALYHYGRTSSAAVKQQATFIMVQAVVFGLLMGNAGIDNYAHLGGFAGGYFTSAFLNPMTRERGDHMIIAMACLGATLLSIVVSVLTGLSLFK
jgi:Rhomboid family